RGGPPRRCAGCPRGVPDRPRCWGSGPATPGRRGPGAGRLKRRLRELYATPTHGEGYSTVRSASVSRFLDLLLKSAAESPRGMTTGEPHEPVRRSWAQVHAGARRMAADLVEVRLRPGTSGHVLAGDPPPIPSAAQAR